MVVKRIILLIPSLVLDIEGAQLMFAFFFCYLMAIEQQRTLPSRLIFSYLMIYLKATPPPQYFADKPSTFLGEKYLCYFML